jgi:hypothetical protein
MEKETILNKPMIGKKPLGKFRNIQELLDFKLDIFNKTIGKVDRKVLENLGK